MNTTDKQKIEEHMKKKYVRRKRTIRTFVQLGGICLGIGVIFLGVISFTDISRKEDMIIFFCKIVAILVGGITVIAWFEKVDLAEERIKLTDKSREIESEIAENKTSVEKSEAFRVRSEKFLETKDAMEYFLSQDLWVIEIWHKIAKLEKKHTKIHIELDFLGGSLFDEEDYNDTE